MRTDRARLGVVLFSGGRGSDVLSRQLVKLPDVVLTIAINGYDDGASSAREKNNVGRSRKRRQSSEVETPPA